MDQHQLLPWLSFITHTGTAEPFLNRQTNGVQLQNADCSAGKGDCRECESAGLVWNQLSEQRVSSCGTLHQ